MRCACLWGLGLFFLILTGCVRTDAPDERNFTILLECAGNHTLPILVEGNAHVGTAELLASKCSLHVNRGNVTVACPSRGLPEYEYPKWASQISEFG